MFMFMFTFSIRLGKGPGVYLRRFVGIVMRECFYTPEFYLIFVFIHMRPRKIFVHSANSRTEEKDDGEIGGFFW